MNFRSYEIKDICKIKSGKRLPKGTDFSEKPTKHKYIRARDIKNGKIDGSDLGYISEEIHKKIARYIVNTNDIIITIAGTIGEVALVSKKFDGVNLTENAVRLTEFSKDVCPEFLAYILKSPERKEYMEQVAGGSAQPKLGIYKIEAIKVDLPDIQIQHKIADILSAYDDLIENNQKQIKLLEEAAQRLYKEWFVDLRFPGHANTKIVDGVPEGWSKSTVSEVSAILRRGISPKYNEKARGIVINQKCIRQTIVSYDEARTQEKKYPDELKMMESDILICSTGAGTLGRVGQVFEAKENVTLDSHVTLIRANERVGQQYLFWSLKMQQDYLMSAGKGSTNQLELSRETIGNCEILVPERKMAGQAEKNFAAIHDKMKECSMKITRLREARDLLLPKLMSGEMEV